MKKKKSTYDLAQEISKSKNPKEVEKLTHSNKWQIRTEAIMRLGEIGNKKSVKRLINILRRSKDKYDIVYANASLGMLKDKSAVPELLKKINSRISDVACSAIYALGEIGDKSAIPYLEKKMESPKIKGVKDYCKTALKKLK